jgi:NAD-dependent deacetylase
VPGFEIPLQLLEAFHEATRVVALTGSGISAESGVPTFRDAQTGLWERYDPLELATPEAFARDPRLVWEWYEWRRGLVANAEPIAGHEALADLESRIPGFTLVTQNVDGLHQRAGSRRVIELHGNIMRSRCSEDGMIVREYEGEETSPRCPRCGEFLRPDVVWIGEMLPSGQLEEASEAARGCNLFLSIGTSSLVYPAAALPYEALENGATLVEINPTQTPLSANADFTLRGPAGKVLPDLLLKVSG